jgi:hypothetical protein
MTTAFKGDKQYATLISLRGSGDGQMRRGGGVSLVTTLLIDHRLQ